VRLDFRHPKQPSDVVLLLHQSSSLSCGTVQEDSLSVSILVHVDYDRTALEKMSSLNSQPLVQSLLFLLLLLSTLCQGWVSPSRISLGTTTRQPVALCSSTAVNSNSESVPVPNANGGDDQEDDDDEEEYEYVEYEILTEPEFMGSEWLVGTIMDSNPKKIVETWVRLASDKNGKNVAIWGDKSEGTWNFDVANQFLSMSKESWVGKDIWAGVVEEDYYFTQGTVRGWNFLSAAEVVGQWQSKRLGVDPDEAGVAPWFQEEEDDETKEEEDAQPVAEADEEEKGIF
jgi:hypothetical protein